nr:hypothetical protein [uncultured Devosia sp.]
MTEEPHPVMREPKGDHNRRLALGVDAEIFAEKAGISVEELRAYELTSPDGSFDLEVARRVGQALQQYEADPPSTQKVQN